MKSIANQYRDLKEGKLSQFNFMRNLRMTMPHLVTNVTSYQDSIKILKNKGILNEIASPSELAMGIKVEMEHTDDIQVAKKIAMDHLAENPTYYSNLKSSGVDTPQGLKSTSTTGGESTLEPNLNRANPRDGFSLGFFEENQEMDGDPATEEEIAAMIAQAEEEESGKYTTGGEQFPIREAKDEKGKWTNADGKSMYAQFKEINNLNGQEVLIGIDYEMQKNEKLTKQEATKIVIKNLKKNPIYYTAEDMSGVEGYEPEYIGGKSAQPEAHQMQYLDKNMGNVVDKKRGMQPVKGIEKVKKDADAKKETNKPEKGITLMSLIAKTVRGLKKMDATGEKMKKISVKENKVANTIFDKNDNITKGISDIAKGNKRHDVTTNMSFTPAQRAAIKKEIPDAEFEEDEQEDTIKTTIYSNKKSEKEMRDIMGRVLESSGLKKINKEALMKMIREELKEMFDGMEPMDRTGLDETDIYSIAGNPEKEKAARLARKPKDKYEPLDKLAAKNIELDNLLSKDMDDIVDEVGDNVRLGIALINRARKTKPSLYPALKQALNFYNK